MLKTFARSVSAAAVVTSMVLNPGMSQACCFSDWCCSCFKSKEPAPVCPAPAAACAVCPQQISYVPQTSYRTEYTCVPCTSCQPVTSACDPCGGSQTVMQPVTSYVRRPVMVPYTSYRPVVTQLNYATPACTTCGASAPYYSGAAYAPAPTSGCATCGGGSAVSYSQPAMAAAPYSAPSYAPAPAYASAPGYTAAPGYAATPGYTVQPSYSMPAAGSTGMMSAPTMGSPTPAAPPSNGVPNTFQPSGTAPSSTVPPVNSSLMPTTPIPDTDKFNSGSAPRLLDPQNRTTSTSPMNPPMVTQAIFNTADANKVFHPATYQPSQDREPSAGWSASSSDNSTTDHDGWQATNGQ